MNPKATELLSKLRSLDRGEYAEEALAQVDAWIKRIEEMDSLDALSTHFLVKQWMEEDKAEIQNIEDILINKRDLEKHERNLLLDKKTMYTKNVHRFDSSVQLDELAKTIDENL